MRDGEQHPGSGGPPRAQTQPGAGGPAKPASGDAVGDTIGADAAGAELIASPGSAGARSAAAGGAEMIALPEPIPPTGRRVGIAETLPAGTTRPGPGIGSQPAMLETLAASGAEVNARPEPIPPTGRRVGIAETLPAGNTRPGPGVGSPPGPAILETLVAGSDPAAGAATVAPDGATISEILADGAAARGGSGRMMQPTHPVIRPPNAEQAPTDTLDTAPQSATLQGPYTVADLPSLPRVNDDTYALGAEIARGGMGKILAARDRRLRREVVIKVMRREYGRIDPRFEREALITARLQHPSIVRVYDAGVLGDGRAFYAMERVRGRSLEVVLADAKTLRERLALLPYAIAVCDALAYAHNEGIVHRDLKPSNVLLGPFGETVVIDWGLAKDLRVEEDATAEPSPLAGAEVRSGDDRESSDDAHDATAAASSEPPFESARTSGSVALTQIGAVMGTPAYMAPEQARGELADERTDVYALGALLYTLLTGAPPVTGTTADEVVAAVASGQRKKIAEVEPELPPELASIVERAMGHERGERYPNAKQLADDLRSFTAGKLVPSHEYTTWELVRRWIARHRVSVGIATTALVLLVTLGVIAYRNIGHERDKARNERDNLIIGQALDARAKDPSRSAAWLKKLTDGALGWRKTTALAAELPTLGLAHEMVGHKQDVEIVLGGPDGKHAATASDDTTIRWWDLDTRTSRELDGHKGAIEYMTISHGGKYLASAGTDHMVILWTLADGGSRVLEGHTNTVRGVAFSPDDSLLASTGEEGTLYLWNVATGKGDRLVDYTHALRPVAWIDNTTLLIGAFDGSIGKVDITTRSVTWFRDDGLKAEVRDIAVTPDHAYWVGTDEDGKVALWTNTGTKVRELTRHQDVAREALITDDGKYVVTCGGNFDVHVHSIPDGTFHPLKGNTAGVKDIDMAGDLVVGAGIDGVVRAWKLDGTLVHEWHGHSAAVKGVSIVGRRVVSGAEDKMVRIWNLDDPPPPPRGTALRGWLRAQTNIEIPDPAD